jgi:hypothetical protein
MLGVYSTGNLELICFESENLISCQNAHWKGGRPNCRPCLEIPHALKAFQPFAERYGSIPRRRPGAAKSPESCALSDEIWLSRRDTSQRPAAAPFCRSRRGRVPTEKSRAGAIAPNPAQISPSGVVRFNHRLSAVCGRARASAAKLKMPADGTPIFCYNAEMRTANAQRDVGL